MAIKPIDMQIMMPRTHDASKVHSEQQNRAAQAQQSANTSVEHMVDDELNKVYEKNNSQKISIKDDEEKKKKEREQKKEQKDGKKNKDNKLGGSIDIKI